MAQEADLKVFGQQLESRIPRTVSDHQGPCFHPPSPHPQYQLRGFQGPPETQASVFLFRSLLVFLGGEIDSRCPLSGG